MPKIMNFNVGNIVYLRGERKDSNIFLLKEGKMIKEIKSLTSADTKKEVVNKGEFFGIRSGMLSLPREETIHSQTNSQVYIFSPQEFDLILKKNGALVIKTLTVFSNDLRKIHKVIENKIGIKDNEEIEKKMLDIANHYRTVKKYKFALYTYNKYLETFPDSVNQSRIKASVEKLKSLIADNS